jgi:NAD+ synthase
LLCFLVQNTIQQLVCLENRPVCLISLLVRHQYAKKQTMKTKSFNSDKLKLDVEQVALLLERFVKDELGKVGFSKGIFGLSGGIDSALTAAITAKALGSENAVGIIMPYKSSNPESSEHAAAVADTLSIPTRTIEITPMVDPYFQQHEPDANSLRRGNVMARQRMIILYDLSSKDHCLVIGTSNRTEILLGYSTLHGDSAHAVNPLGDLLKTQVWQLAEYYKLPKEVISKAPSADLWQGQTDEEELGISYAMADAIITLLVDERIPARSIPDYGLPAEAVDRVMKLMSRNQFKRMPPIIAKLSHRTIGRDFRYPRDWGV